MEKEDEFFLAHPSRRAYFVQNYFLVVFIFAMAIFVEIAALIGIIENTVIVLLLLFFALILMIISIGHTILHCKHTFVMLEKYKISYETGIINRKRKVVPLDHITDTSMEQNVIDLLLGTATLNISTAGSRSYEITASCLKYEAAAYIHEKIHIKIKGQTAKKTKKTPSAEKNDYQEGEFLVE